MAIFTASQISDRIVDAVLAHKLAPNTRLGEQKLGQLFDCSRTKIREALCRLDVQRIVVLKSRFGWFTAAPSHDLVLESFRARRILESGLLRTGRQPNSMVIKILRKHLDDQKSVINTGDVHEQQFLLSDFHVSLAKCLGNQLLAAQVRNLASLTSLGQMLYKAVGDTAGQYREHASIVDAVEACNLQLAEQTMDRLLVSEEQRCLAAIKDGHGRQGQLRHILNLHQPAPAS